MRILMFLGRRAGLPALLALSLAGCYIPGGGWTLRTGADFRTRYKPGVFLEMVDTRWDEYNRVACQNTQCQPRMHSHSRTGTGTGPGSGNDSTAGSGCFLGLPMPGTITPIPSSGPTLAPGFAPDPNRGTAPDSRTDTPPNGLPPNPQYPQPPAPTPYPVPQPYPNDGPSETPAEPVPGNASQGEPSPIPGVTTSGQSLGPSSYGNWPTGGSGPALMLPAPDPVMPAFGDTGQGPAEPVSGASPNAGLELSSYEQSGQRDNSNRFTAGQKMSPGRSPARPAGRKRIATDPTNPAGANRYFGRPRT